MKTSHTSGGFTVIILFFLIYLNVVFTWVFLGLVFWDIGGWLNSVCNDLDQWLIKPWQIKITVSFHYGFQCFMMVVRHYDSMMFTMALVIFLHLNSLVFDLGNFVLEIWWKKIFDSLNWQYFSRIKSQSFGWIKENYLKKNHFHHFLYFK